MHRQNLRREEQFQAPQGRSFATMLLELGVDIKIVSVLPVHGSAKTTPDYYAYSLIEQQRAAMNLLTAC